ncbi:hypothetical protein Tco_0133703 [Tanacetum coccineum]
MSVTEFLISDNLDDKKEPSKASVPIFEWPSVQGLLGHYEYNDIEEYLLWNYFPSTNKKNTDKDITDKDIIDEDCIHESNYAMSKGKYVPVSQKHNLKVKSSVPVTRCVLGLANVTTWDEIVNKIGVRKFEICTDKEKGKIKLTFASKHLQFAFASKNLQLAFASCICKQAFAACICKQAFATCICILHLQMSTRTGFRVQNQEVKNKHLRHLQRIKYKHVGQRLWLENAKTWDAILSKTFRVKIPPTMACAEDKKRKRKISRGS